MLVLLMFFCFLLLFIINNFEYILADQPQLFPYPPVASHITEGHSSLVSAGRHSPGTTKGKVLDMKCLTTLWCHYDCVDFLQNPHKRHSIACL